MCIANWEGFSMEDAREHCFFGASKAQDLSPQDVLQSLQKGNTRFFQGIAVRPELSAFSRRSLIVQQYPKVAVLGCSDSRVPVEIVFDQGLGDIFVVRVAGNCLDTTTTASLQYAVCHLKVKVLVVMGHEGCGAVKAAGMPEEKIQNEPPALAKALTMLKEGLDEERLSNVYDSRAHDREAVVTNVQRQVEGLTHDQHIMRAVRLKELIVIGAFYEISSGIVDFFLEVTDAPTHIEANLPAEPTPAPPGSPGAITRMNSRVCAGAPHEGVQTHLEVFSDDASWAADEMKQWKSTKK
jgi:carbonic anhydrase